MNKNEKGRRLCFQSVLLLLYLFLCGGGGGYKSQSRYSYSKDSYTISELLVFCGAVPYSTSLCVRMRGETTKVNLPIVTATTSAWQLLHSCSGCSVATLVQTTGPSGGAVRRKTDSTIYGTISFSRVKTAVYILYKH